MAPFLHVKEEICYNKMVCSWICLLHEDLLVHPDNLSNWPSAQLVKVPNTHLLKEKNDWMNESLHLSTYTAMSTA